jgi:vacuolar protein-sorting-associated protein 4
MTFAHLPKGPRGASYTLGVGSLLNSNHSYSGSDIAAVVKDALMRPLRPALAASHFKRVGTNTSDIKWTPCSPSNEDAVPMTWREVPSNQLLEPPLTTDDFLLSLESTRPTVTIADIKLHEEWTMNYGVFDISAFHI